MPLGYTLDENSVLSITELASDMLDEQPMRVFELTIHPDAAAFVGMLNTTDFFSTSVGADLDVDIFSPLLQPQTTIIQQVWVGEDDGLVHQIVGFIDTSVVLGSASFLNHQFTTTANFSDFGEPIEIEVPEPFRD